MDQFTTRDPMDGVDGTPTVANPYHYVDNDPLNKVDPSGIPADVRSVPDSERTSIAHCNSAAVAMTGRSRVAIVRILSTTILLPLVLLAVSCGDSGPGLELGSQGSPQTTTGETEATASTGDYRLGLVIHLSPSATPPEIESLFRPLGLPRYPFDGRIDYTSMTVDVLWFGDPSDELVESYVSEVTSSPIVLSIERVG